MKTRIRCSRVLVLLCLLGMLTVSSPCLAAELTDTTVRVGYYDLPEYYITTAAGTVDSYDFAFLDMVAEYTGLTFKYIDCGSWENEIEMLKAHEIDLIGTLQWTPEQEDEFAICRTSYGYTVGEIAVLRTTGYVYEDYSQLEGMTVGYAENYVSVSRLTELLAAHNTHCTLVSYPDNEALAAALESGQIDALAASSLAVKNSWEILDKFDYAPVFFASWKGNEALADTINEAIIMINLYQEDFDDTLFKQYFPRLVNSPYNESELSCIREGKTYTVYLEQTAKPVSWYSGTTDSMDGILSKICAMITARSGLILAQRPASEQGTENRDYSVSVYLYPELFDAAPGREYGRTNAIFSEEYYLYHISGQPYSDDASTHYTVAIPTGHEITAQFLQSNYPSYEVINGGTQAECIELLLHHDVDLVFMGNYAENDIAVTDNISGISAIPTSGITYGVGLQFFGEKADILADTVDKAFRLITADEMTDVILQYVTDTAPEATLGYFISENLPAAIAALVFVFALVMSSLILAIYGGAVSKKNRQIQAANAAKADFFARMSHDMRTPMNGVLGMIELTRQATTLEEVRRNMDKAQSSGEYMLSLINDSLDLQRLETSKLSFEFEIVKISSFLDNITEMIRLSAAQKNIRFDINNIKIDTEGYIRIDPVRVKQIFVNLLSNALKFTPDGGVIELRAERLGWDGSTSHDVISVRDTGIGMSEAFIKESLFKPYSQERNAVTSQYAGSGLGLAIVKNLVELMNGRIEVESTPGKGTCFRVYLEFEHVEKEAAESALHTQSAAHTAVQNCLRGKHILVCEDHPLNAEILKRLLEKVGCTVVVAEDGKLGLNAFAASGAGEFDCILMDIRMPVMDGLAAAVAIRDLDRPDAAAVPIIALSANAYEADIQRSKQAGMNEHLAKPIVPQTLYETMEKLITALQEQTGAL